MNPAQCIDSLYSVAYALLDAERIRDATNAFRVMVRFAPLDERAWLGLGECHERVGEIEIASELYGAGASVSSPPSARCFVALARLARRSGELDAAAEHYDSAASLAEEAGDDAMLDLLQAEAVAS